MKNVLLNSAYFAPISYFSAIAEADSVYIERYENFGKQSYRNRCEIMTANGVISLTVPVVRANSKTIIKDLKIVYATPWQKLHLRSIKSAYSNSPYYDYYIDELMPFFEKKEIFLLDLNQALLETLLQLLKIDRPVYLTDDYVPDGHPGFTDLRDAFHPKANRRRTVPIPKVRPYRQTFCDRFPFTPDLSVLDSLFCCGGIN